MATSSTEEDYVAAANCLWLVGWWGWGMYDSYSGESNRECGLILMIKYLFWVGQVSFLVFQEFLLAVLLDILDAPVKAPSTTASTAQHTDGDPEAEHKMCIKYASNVDSASDDDTPVNLFAVVDWELLSTGLGYINVFYRKDNSRKCFTSLREILHLGDLKVLIDSPEVNDGSDVWKNQHTWSIQSWKLYSYSGVHVLETLEICPDTVGNELTTAVKLIAFLKKQISDSRRPKVHDCPCLDADFLVADSKFMKVAFGDGFKMLLFNPLVISTKDLSRNLQEFLLVALLVPTSYFWSTTSLRAPELGPPAILATIDRTPYTITEDTVRSQLQLGDDGVLTSVEVLGSHNTALSQYQIWFLQIILGIETRNTKQYHVLKLSSKLFANMRLNFEGDHMPLLAAMLPPAQAAIADEGTGEAAPDVPQTIPETIQETRPEPDQSQEHLPTPPRPTTSDQIPPVFEQGHTSDPNIASFSGAHESDPDLFTSTNVEDETLGGSFHTTPPRSTQVPPVGPTSGGAEDLATLTALSSLVSELVQKVSTLESELKAHKLLFTDVVPKLVKKVKALEVKLKTKKRKVVLSDSDQEDGGEPDVDLDALNALANAAVTVDSTKSPGGPSKNPAACSYDPTSDVPSTEFPTDVPSDGAPTGPSTVSPGSTTVPTSSSVPAAATIPASSGTTPETPSSPVRDARKGKGVAVEEPTPTHDKTFKQLEEERLGWEAAQRLQAQELADFEKQRAESLMKDANLARQMSQDFEMTEDQRKRQQEVLASAANYSDAAWDIILARLQANPDLSSTIFGVEFTDDDFAARMVELVNTRRKELAEQRAQERRERPMTPSQLRQYMRTYVKNQGPAVYSTGWTMAQVQKLSPEQLQEEFDKI
ncbi:hypothetical protein Tco_0520729 [Tanacetum coccineum]